MTIYRSSPKFRSTLIDWQFDIHIDSSAGDPTVPAAAVNAAVEVNLIPVLATDTQFLGSQIADPYAKTIAGQFLQSATQPFGTEGATGLPPVACYTVSLYDGVYGRGRTGKIFISGVPVDAYAGGNLLSAFVGTAQTAFQGFVDDVNAGAGQVVVYSKKDGAGYPVFRLTVQSVLREQRRREFGRSIKH